MKIRNLILTNQIAAVRKQLSHEKGILLNPIRIRDNLQMEQNEYVIKIKGNGVASGELYTDRFLVVEPGGASRNLILRVFRQLNLPLG